MLQKTQEQKSKIIGILESQKHQDSQPPYEDDLGIQEIDDEEADIFDNFDIKQVSFEKKKIVKKRLASAAVVSGSV